MGDAGYDEVAEAYDAWVDQQPDRTLLDLIGPVAGLEVLSLACGQGRDARMVARAGATVTGVDTSAKLVDLARRHEAGAALGIRYLLGDAQTLDEVPDASFDGVVCHMALMDIPDLGATLGTVRRVLRPHGWFVCSINHPCFKPPRAGELLDHRDGSVQRVVGQYFTEGEVPAPQRSHDALPPTTHHRTLSTYLNGLADAGLSLVAAAEPAGAADRPVWHSVPCLLYLRCAAVPR
ncbi:class I SAM-dependent methyltransferase [Desertihabitans aurantiacus]|uniref:class I SAM-dependent methyltransferase n=1 Tax=Desertihabitans aurantiacus TaxID=2282477 RepID=UPI001E349414|nr:class I SAM-dependent methyltransferase [Desertihabitans aurantiacus]